MVRVGYGILVLLVWALCTEDARAAVFVPMSMDDLADSSAAVVLGTVGTQTAVVARDGRIYTLVDVSVEQVLKGDVPAATITLKENGGSVAGRQEIVFGAPRFQTGERVLLFLTLRADGSLQTNQLAMGKLDVVLDTTGMPRAARRFGAGTLMVVPPGVQAPRGSLPLNEVIATVARAGARKPRARSEAVLRLRPPEATDPSLPSEVSDAFTLLGSGRFFEPDEGKPLSFLIDERGDDILGLSVSRGAVDDAFAAWTNVESAAITLQDGGLGSDLSTACSSGHKVRFNDPDREIPNPVNCTGTLGVGGLCSDSSQTKFFDGTAFNHASRALLTLADGWDGCAVWNECNLAEVATHEIGHAIGLGHSSENPDETNPVLKEATMYFLAHFDGRCAAVRTDDVDGLTFLYPTTVPPTITSADRLPSGILQRPYTATLTAKGGTGTFMWELVNGDFPGLSLSTDGVLSGAPQAVGMTSLLIKATDAKGDFHAKRFSISVDLTASCIGDCNGDGVVTIDELIRGLNIALGGAPLGVCVALDDNGDQAVTVDELVTAVGVALNGCVPTTLPGTGATTPGSL